MAYNKVSYSFKKGFDMLRKCDQAEVKEQIMTYLGITTKMAWSKRIRGLIVPNVAEYHYITNIINKYGVKKREIWEEVEL